jgi:D-alanyl-D-alanine dipeptidase
LIRKKLHDLKNSVILPTLCTLLMVTGCRNSTQRHLLQDSLTDGHRVPKKLYHTNYRLISLQKCIPGILVDLRYATPENITGRRLYPKGMKALLDTQTARKLKKAQAYLATHGKGLKIWDAYRPPEIQWQLLKSDTTRTYVADPKQWWSKHCSGRAVDVTLIELKTGSELKMPSAFDDFSSQASSDYRGPDMQVAENLKLLQSTMRKAGFIGFRKEWWHYANADHFSRNIAPITAKKAGIQLSGSDGID